jgi:hypothetical protein
MKIPGILFFILCITINSTHAQGHWEWAKAGGWGSGEGSWLGSTFTSCVDSSGNIYTQGAFFECSSDSSLKANVIVTKFEASGDIVWAKGFGGNGIDVSTSICTDRTGSVYVSGFYNSDTLVIGTDTFFGHGSDHIFLVKYDPSGNVIWAKGMTGASSSYVTTDGNENVYISGFFKGDSILFDSISLVNRNSLNESFFIAKYNSSGQLEWAKNSSGCYTMISTTSICSDPSSNIYVTGFFNCDTLLFGNQMLIPHAGALPGFLVKYDSMGNAVWVRSIDGYVGLYQPNVDMLTTDLNGNILLSGNTATYGNYITFDSLHTVFLSRSEDLFIAKYSPSGMWPG